ncbi:hypothetical protein NJF44_11090 [Pseudomonas guariconensis]|uniref:hypothetical protein n=1 Tax=Pseudomonas TaxID=286 RepID=UPI002097EC73|nr:MULTISPECIES: hypothetical protein [Pseudomonas]MCO7642609.1 hypothetical protein [Pseudomonas sp. S 311-6]MCO7517333.1 hypothetical protein [Pseudomonas putida]MCO7567409.1 hypothetical protein [Pseudomonas mosselii]MCO7597224.1 hypothetical protein [Pseudomonas guariconensis]MCO7605775.1 hypothetical protein [Pseudomonas guariconensis]
MTDAHEPVLVAETIEAFRGKIYMLVDNRRVPLRLSRSTDKFSWGFAPQDDWLQAGGQADSPVFHFTFLSQTENRHHFSIRGTGRHADKKLGISLNGYLGLYKHAEVTDFWKLETLNWTEQGLHCRWRDHQGQQVKAIMDTPHHEPGTYYLLNVQEGEVHEFLIERVD